MSGVDELQRVVSDYRGGIYAGTAASRVDRWLGSFRVEDRAAIADELAFVLSKTYLTHELATDGVRRWLSDPSTIASGAITSWEHSTFLDVQVGGGSQSALLSLLELGMPTVRENRGAGLYVYVDDVSVHGMRILNDLTSWLRDDAPSELELLILLQRGLADRRSYVTEQLASRARAVGKRVHVRWWCDQEFRADECYQPDALPDDPRLAAYLEESGVEPRLRTGNGTGPFFSSTVARRLLESALLCAGARVLAQNNRLQPRKYMRPLGNTVWSGLGIGVPIVTWRNCPNSAPLALWAESDIPPLFPRNAN